MMLRGKLLNFRVLPVVLITLLVLAHGRPALSAGYGPMEPVSIDVSNTAALQRGARNFANYCMGCHSAEFMRFNRLAEGLQLTEAQVMENLAFSAERPHDTMQIAMRMSDAEQWFGQPPPDLSLIARVRGTTWLYNFLRSYYPDELRPTGMNNLNLTGTSMPHVLWELQGEQRPLFETRSVGGVEREVFVGFEQVSPGLLTPEEYDAFVRDIVTFLSFVGEPMQLERQRLGVIVIAFLLVFGLFAWLLQQEIWKDVK